MNPQFCEHANETPRGRCGCPVDCYCRSRRVITGLVEGSKSVELPAMCPVDVRDFSSGALDIMHSALDSYGDSQTRTLMESISISRKAVWDVRFMALAKVVATWSKDPNHGVGAVIVDDQRRVISLGYNGFPRKVLDTPERLADRELKNKLTVHAEANAITSARGEISGCVIYATRHPCADCAKLIIQSGIKRVVSPARSDAGNWAADAVIATTMLSEAGVSQDTDWIQPGESASWVTANEHEVMLRQRQISASKLERELLSGELSVMVGDLRQMSASCDDDHQRAAVLTGVIRNLEIQAKRLLRDR